MIQINITKEELVVLIKYYKAELANATSLLRVEDMNREDDLVHTCDLEDIKRLTVRLEALVYELHKGYDNQ